MTFFHYIRQQGLETREVIFTLLSLAILLFSSFLAHNLWRDSQQDKPLTYGAIAGPFMGVLLSSGFFLMVYLAKYKTHLLRAGVARYTVGRVFDYGSSRGYNTFVYEYYIAGKRYQSARKCGVEEWHTLPCPSIGTRYYVKFSPEEPDSDVVTKQVVPDSVRTIPPLGWAKLP